MISADLPSWILNSVRWCSAWLQMEYERQVASIRAQNALEGDFSISQAETSSRQAMLENASDIKVVSLPDERVNLIIYKNTVLKRFGCF